MSNMTPGLIPPGLKHHNSILEYVSSDRVPPVVSWVRRQRHPPMNGISNVHTPTDIFTDTNTDRPRSVRVRSPLIPTPSFCTSNAFVSGAHARCRGRANRHRSAEHKDTRTRRRTRRVTALGCDPGDSSPGVCSEGLAACLRVPSIIFVASQFHRLSRIRNTGPLPPRDAAETGN